MSVGRHGKSPGPGSAVVGNAHAGGTVTATIAAARGRTAMSKRPVGQILERRLRIPELLVAGVDRCICPRPDGRRLGWLTSRADHPSTVEPLHPLAVGDGDPAGALRSDAEVEVNARDGE